MTSKSLEHITQITVEIHRGTSPAYSAQRVPVGLSQENEWSMSLSFNDIKQQLIIEYNAAS